MFSEPGEKQAYTIEDVAKALGVSKTTVSRAISGKGRLSEQTRARVLAFIEAHNYRPNAVAQSLAQSRTCNLGFVIPEDSGMLDFSFFKDCMTGICKEAQEHGYDVLVMLTDGRSVDRLEQILANRKVDGMIVSRSRIGSPIVKLLKEESFPFVLLGESDDPQVLFVDNANREACCELSALLVERGERRMALLCGDWMLSVTHSRYRGFEAACCRSGLVWEEQIICRNVLSRECVAKALDEIIASGTTCIVCMDEMICSLTLVMLRERGIRVPQDMHVACFYDSNILKDAAPSISGVRFDSLALGRLACRKLLYKLEGRAVSNEILRGYQILIRESTPRR